jgi:hypothetical protein
VYEFAVANNSISWALFDIQFRVISMKENPTRKAASLDFAGLQKLVRFLRPKHVLLHLCRKEYDYEFCTEVIGVFGDMDCMLFWGISGGLKVGRIF